MLVPLTTNFPLQKIVMFDKKKTIVNSTLNCPPMNSNHYNLLMLMIFMVVHMIFTSTTREIYMMGL
jgi:hypothetical protein